MRMQLISKRNEEDKDWMWNIGCRKSQVVCYCVNQWISWEASSGGSPEASEKCNFSWNCTHNTLQWMQCTECVEMNYSVLPIDR